MRVLMGGSFDPVHDGHIQTAIELTTLLGVEQIHLVPAACSPLKQPGYVSDMHRLAMLHLAATTHSVLHINECELLRPAPSYTIDTLRQQRAALGPNEPLVWVIGSDALSSLHRWKDWQDMTQLAHLLVVARPGFPLPAHSPATQWFLARPRPQPRPGNLDALHCSPHGLCTITSLTPQPFSSTAIRLSLSRSERPAGLTDAVWHYICENKLYVDNPASDSTQ